MVDKELRDYFEETCIPGALIFENPSFDKSVIGISSTGQIVYSYDKMVNELAEEDNITTEEAAEFIDYNTLGALSYMDYSTKPIVVFDLEL